MELGAALQTMVGALALPEQAMVRQRVPKKHLVESGKPTVADKRAAQEGIEVLWWVAVLRPGNCGIPAYRDEQVDYSELSVLALCLRPEAPVARLAALVQRSIPYPIILLVEQAGAVDLYLATKRASLNEAGRWVVEHSFATGPMRVQAPDAHVTDFLDSLPLHRVRAADLKALYQAYIHRVEALLAARITGHFELPGSEADSQRRREALAASNALAQELAATIAKARKEKVTHRAVALQLEVQRITNELAARKQQL